MISTSDLQDLHNLRDSELKFSTASGPGKVTQAGDVLLETPNNANISEIRSVFVNPNLPNGVKILVFFEFWEQGWRIAEDQQKKTVYIVNPAGHRLECKWENRLFWVKLPPIKKKEPVQAQLPKQLFFADM